APSLGGAFSLGEIRADILARCFFLWYCICVQPSGAVFSKKSTTIMAKLGFIRNTRNEMRHVVWPSRARTVAYTAIIIVLSFALGYFLSGVDSVFRAVLRTLI